jgi:hypothetical protein
MLHIKRCASVIFVATGNQPGAGSSFDELHIQSDGDFLAY